ncbi:MAG TPA: hypothetical protein VGQ36_03560 [Thermoanaerobaculia bacterium]|jgi:hypothetical protein|nr:hypothetical protein [Thermoanaerobaculia bacterium]
MPEHIQYEDDDLFNPDTHHEHSDVPVRPLFWFIVIFVVFAAVSHVALLLLYKAFVKGERSRMDAPQTQVTRPANADVPQNQPLLQPFPRTDAVPYRQTPVTDLEDMRRAEDARLGNYGWVDKQHGAVHIPIEEAKKLLAAKMAAASQTTPGAPASLPAGPPASLPAASGAGGTQ